MSDLFFVAIQYLPPMSNVFCQLFLLRTATIEKSCAIEVMQINV